MIVVQGMAKAYLALESTTRLGARALGEMQCSQSPAATDDEKIATVGNESALGLSSANPTSGANTLLQVPRKRRTSPNPRGGCNGSSEGGAGSTSGGDDEARTCSAFECLLNAAAEQAQKLKSESPASSQQSGRKTPNLEEPQLHADIVDSPHSAQHMAQDKHVDGPREKRPRRHSGDQDGLEDGVRRGIPSPRLLDESVAVATRRNDHDGCFGTFPELQGSHRSPGRVESRSRQAAAPSGKETPRSSERLRQRPSGVPLEDSAMYAKAVIVLEKKLGPKHPEVGRAQLLVARWYFSKGLNKEGEECLHKSMAIFKENAANMTHAARAECMQSFICIAEAMNCNIQVPDVESPGREGQGVVQQGVLSVRGEAKYGQPRSDVGLCSL